MAMIQPDPYGAVPNGAQPTTKASNTGYWIAALIDLFGLGGAVIWFVVVLTGTVVTMASMPDDFARVDIPGTATVLLEEGDNAIYLEGPEGSGVRSQEPPVVEVTEPDGTAVFLRRVAVDTTYSWAGRAGIMISEFHVDRSGAYTVAVRGEPSIGMGRSAGYKVAVGKKMDVSMFARVVPPILVGSVCFLVGTVVLIVTIVRNSRARRAASGQPQGPQPPGGLSAAPQAGPYQPGYQQPYPPQPYQPQPYPPQQYPPQQYPSGGDPWQPGQQGSHPQDGGWPQPPGQGWPG